MYYGEPLHVGQNFKCLKLILLHSYTMLWAQKDDEKKTNFNQITYIEL